MENKSVLHILGAGPAGMACGYYATKKKIPVNIYDSSNEVGGNGKTLTDGAFRFDMGAHRFHDKYDDVTLDVMDIVGNELCKVQAPSKIYYNSSMIDFPLSIKSILNNLDSATICKIILEKIQNSIKKSDSPSNFKELAYYRYGKTISELFLINYTEKLWGRSAEDLQINIAGDRLRNLNIASLLRDVILRSEDTNHLDGSFYYPKYGFGTIFQKIKEYIGDESFHLKSQVKKILCKGNKIEKVFYGNSSTINVEKVISTLPLNTLIDIMDPEPSSEIKDAVNKIKYRDLSLCVIYLDMPFFTDNASIYFPESSIPFTRIYEPKNRSKYMAPHHKTCIVIEVPRNQNGVYTHHSKQELFNVVSGLLIDKGLIKREHIIGHSMYYVPNAYPVLNNEIERALVPVFSYLDAFENMDIIGRNAEFKYLHTHNIFKKANTIISKLYE